MIDVIILIILIGLSGFFSRRGLVWVKERMRKNLEEESSTKTTTPNLYHRVPNIRVSTSTRPQERERLPGTDTLPQSCTEMGGIVIKSPDVADINLVDSCCVG